MAGSSERRARRDLFVDVALASAALAALLLDAQYGENGRGITIVGFGAALGAMVPLLWRRSGAGAGGRRCRCAGCTTGWA